MTKRKGISILAEAPGDGDILDRVDVESLLDQLGVSIVEYQDDEILCWCPFHEMDGKAHKSPSFLINQTTTQWVCRSQCGGGNGISLVQYTLELEDGSAAWGWLNTFVNDLEALEQKEQWDDESDYEVPLIEELAYLEETKQERKQRKIYRDMKRGFLASQVAASRRIGELEQRVRHRLLGDELDLRVFYAIQSYRDMVPDADIRNMVNSLPDNIWLYLDFQEAVERDLWEWLEKILSKMRYSLLRVKGGSRRHEDSLQYGIQRSVYYVGQRIRDYKKKYKQKYLDMS